MGQTYTIVAGSKDGEGRPLDAEVRIRAYKDARCKCCGASADELDYNTRMDAAYNDGLALGRMLREHGAGEYTRGLQDGLNA